LLIYTIWKTNPDGNYKKFTFFGSAGVEVALERHGQPNLRTFAAQRENWELSTINL
jgi:hypothetical protein